MLDSLIRMRSAAALLPTVGEEGQQLLSEWLDQMLLPMSPLADDTQLRVAVSADLRETTWSAANTRTLLVEKLAALMEYNGLPAEEAAALQRAAETLGGVLWSWLTTDGSQQRGGWLVEGVLPLADAWKFFPSHQANATLAEWCRRGGADACIAIGRCAGADPYGILKIEPWGESILADLQLHNGICEELGVAPLPEPLLELVLEDDPDYLEFSFWVGSPGVVQVGVAVPRPGDELVLKSAMVLGEESVDSLAAFEGALGVERCSAVELRRLAEGLAMRIHYDCT